MEVLHKKYPDTLEILAFPCNNFGSQEPKPNEEIEKTVREKFGYSGPLYGKLECDNGASTHPLFVALMEGIDNGIYGQGLKWNFAKFLCNSDGVAVQRYSPKTAPLSFEEDICKMMGMSEVPATPAAVAASQSPEEKECKS